MQKLELSTMVEVAPLSPLARAYRQNLETNEHEGEKGNLAWRIWSCRRRENKRGGSRRVYIMEGYSLLAVELPPIRKWRIPLADSLAIMFPSATLRSSRQAPPGQARRLRRRRPENGLLRFAQPRSSHSPHGPSFSEFPRTCRWRSSRCGTSSAQVAFSNPTTEESMFFEIWMFSTPSCVDIVITVRNGISVRETLYAGYW